MGAAGRRRAESEFSLTGMIAAYEDMYLELAGMRPRSARHEVRAHMCGIAGRFNFRSGAPVDAAVVREHVHAARPSRSGRRRRVDSGRRRVWATGGWRSSISADAGRQPMSSADGRLWITFNGEIYNFLELRERARIATATASARTPTPRSCSRRTAQCGADVPRAPARHVRVRDLGRAASARCSSRATAWARSRSTTGSIDDGIAFASEPKAFLAEPGFEARPNLDRDLALPELPVRARAALGVRRRRASCRRRTTSSSRTARSRSNATGG